MARKVIGIMLAVVMMATALTTSVSALPFVTGEQDGYTEEVFDGVYHTYIATEGSPYGRQKFHIVEFDLAQRNLDVEILKNDYIAGKKTVPNFVKEYNTANKEAGKEIIAAINGDLWMTGVHSNSKVSKSILTVPRGVLMSKGVVYCSSQIPNECTYTTNGEGHGYFWAFGLTDERLPLIGQPVLTFNVKNNTKNLSAFTEGYNRLPAHDSLIIYDGNCNYTNYALDDAYEVVLNNVNGEFKFGTTVSGTVSAIYGPNDSTSPTLEKGSIVLTARGTAIDYIKDYVIGDDVSIDFSVRDVSGRDNDWTKAVTIIGGHSPIMLDGVSTQPIDNTNYPCTMVGVKNDGKLIFLQNDGRQPNWSTGLSISMGDEFMQQLGVNSIIHLDGGGSSTMVVGDELVNKPSDGSTRAVINGMALVSCPEREEQGDYEMKLPYRFNARYIKFDTQGAVDHLSTIERNATTATLEDGFVRFQPPHDTNDPYIYYDISTAYNTLSAKQYKYIVMKYRTPEGVTTPRTELFLCSGNVGGPTGGCSVVFNHDIAGQWNTQIVDLTAVSFWSGNIHGIRLDYFAGNAKQNEYFDLEYIALAKTEEDALAYANGTAEIPTVPPESASITAKAGSGLKIENGYLKGVKSDSVGYDVVAGAYAPKLEIFDAEGNSIRNQSVCTGYKIVSYNTALERVMELVIAVAGDLDCDGIASNIDAARVLRYDAGIVDLDDLQVAAGDTNGDGNVDNIDAAYILKIDAGLINP